MNPQVIDLITQSLHHNPYIQQSECQPLLSVLIHFFGSSDVTLLLRTISMAVEAFEFLNLIVTALWAMIRCGGGNSPQIDPNAELLIFSFRPHDLVKVSFGTRWITFQPQPLHKCFLLFDPRLDFLCLRLALFPLLNSKIS